MSRWKWKKKNKNDNPPHYNRNLNIVRGIFFSIVAIVMFVFFKNEMISIFSFSAQKPKIDAPPIIIDPPLDRLIARSGEVSASVSHEEGLSLILKNDCVACHKDTLVLGGPAYADIAAKHKGDPVAIKTLTKSIKLGSGGKWGAIPMLSHEKLRDEDIEKMAKYILSVKGGRAPIKPPLSEIQEIR
jgi:cytochrome c